ncbi:PilZ domain-containing protein [Aestuariibacter salexigens]|uniref:PilZ domain-containing protein n=1 Tax=Aestuariibacter salexigens TaxID=226010 RepID=UPI00040F49AE|nr:PilZ domain-containing protein [Aestuariibacter salexigens]
MAILQEKVGLSNVDLRKLRSLRPGMPLDIQVKTPKAIKRVRTEFVGMDGTKNLIMRFPDENKWGSMRDAIYADNSMVVRFILEDEAGEVVAFKVKILLVLTKPSHLVFTSFPLSIQCQGLRSENRAKVSISTDVLLRDQQDELYANARIRDISKHGCQFALRRKKDRQRLAAGTNVTLVIGSDDNQIQLNGEVKNSKLDETHIYYGTKFDAEPEIVNSLLQQLMIL